jgi:hypothetical protein
MTNRNREIGKIPTYYYVHFRELGDLDLLEKSEINNLIQFYLKYKDWPIVELQRIIYRKN